MKFFKHLKGVSVNRWLIKSLLIMKLTFILVFISCLQVCANGYSQTVTLNMKSVELKKALITIEKNSNYRFLYSERKIANNNKVSIDVTDVSISTALGQLLNGTSLTFKELKNNLIVITNNDEVVQDIIVKGKVTDRSNGQPLVGVSVQIKGSKVGTSTDGTGSYSLEVPDKATLVVSSVGYDRVEVPVNGRSVLNIEMAPATRELNEVVVTALGIKREIKALGYAVQTVGGKDIQTVKGVDAATSLTGKVAGLVIKNSTEFNAVPTIELRGETPMLVIDGVPYGNMTLRDIPSDNIESISVLKGPTAAALYGAQGANGAVMITTKKGKGNGLSIDINSNTMVASGFLSIPKIQTSYAHGIDGKISDDYVWGPKLDIGDSAIQWNPITKQNENMPLISSGKRNLQNFLQTGIITNNNISVTQSGENGYFRAGINHIYNHGQFPNAKLNIINYTMSGAMKVGDKLNIESQMGYTRQTSPQIWGTGYGNQGYLYQILMWTGPDYDIRQYRDYWVTPNQKQNWLYNAWYDNPYLIAYEKLNSIDQNKLNASLTANYKISKDLNLMFRTGYDYYKNEQTVRSPAGINSTRGGGNNQIHGGEPYLYTFSWNYGGKGMYGADQMWGFSTNNDLIATYSKKISKFDVNILGGGSIAYHIDREMGSQTRNGLSVPGWYSLANAVPSTTAGVDALITNFGTWKEQVNSLYGKASFGWNNILYLDVTGRNDWSSTQKSSQRSYFYPSVSGSVILSQFIPVPEYVNMWKVRGSWTQDKLPENIYANNRTFSGGTSWGLPNSNYPNNLLGKDLLPTSTRTWETGTEAILFGGRLHADVAYFNKLYYNQQFSAPISQASGFNSSYINSLETTVRRGWEVTVDGSIIKRKNFEWHSMINYSFQHRYYGDLDPVYSADNLWTKKGGRKDGYISEPYERDPQGNIVNNAGLPVLSDYNANLGYTDPKFSFGFINNFTIKDFIIGVSVDGRIGGIMYDYIWNKMFDTGTNPETDNKWRYDQVVNGLTNFVAPGVKVVSGEATYDKYGRILTDTRKYAANDVAIGYQDYAQALNGIGYEHGLKNKSFVKLREVSIGYKIPSRALGKTGIKNASVSLTAQNVLMWTNFSFSDPDVDNENLNSPSQRMVGLSIKLGF